MPTFQTQVRPSKTYLLLFLFMISGALLSIFYSFLTYYIRFLLSLAVILYGGQILWDTVLLRGKKAIVRLTSREDNSWLLQDRCGEEYQAALRGDSTRLAWVSILRFNCFAPDKTRSVVIFHDALQTGDYRRMLMKLGTLKVQ